MQRILQLLVALLVVAVSGTAARAENRKDQHSFEVHVLFKIGTKAWDSDSKAVQDWVRAQIETAERMFSDDPKLVIKPSFQRIEKLGDKDTSELHFSRSGKYRTWMNRYVDNKASSKTEGHLTVLVVDEICFDNPKRRAKKTGESERCIGGRSWFPHWITPFVRKTGIIIRYQDTPYLLAHEIGHMLGLKHTFVRYVGVTENSDCNRTFRRSHCGSCVGTTSKGECSRYANVMDYCKAPSKILNSCQKKRAAAQRRMYMTRKGETKYKKLTGRN